MDKFNKWLEENDWARNLRKLKSKLDNSGEYEILRANMKEERKKHNLMVRVTRSPVAKYITIGIISVVIYFIFYLINNKFSLNLTLSQLIVPILAFVLSFVALDIRKFFE